MFRNLLSPDNLPIALDLVPLLATLCRNPSSLRILRPQTAQQPGKPTPVTQFVPYLLAPHVSQGRKNVQLLVANCHRQLREQKVEPIRCAIPDIANQSDRSTASEFACPAAATPADRTLTLHRLPE